MSAARPCATWRRGDGDDSALDSVRAPLSASPLLYGTGHCGWRVSARALPSRMSRLVRTTIGAHLRRLRSQALSRGYRRGPLRSCLPHRPVRAGCGGTLLRQRHSRVGEGRSPSRRGCSRSSRSRCALSAIAAGANRNRRCDRRTCARDDAIRSHIRRRRTALRLLLLGVAVTLVSQNYRILLGGHRPPAGGDGHRIGQRGAHHHLERLFWSPQLGLAGAGIAFLASEMLLLALPSARSGCSSE